MMSPLYPSLPGLSWGIVKTPIWSTGIQTAASGRELRTSYYATPIYEFKLPYEFLRSRRQHELQTLLGFINLRQGSFGSFYYEDPSDSAAINEQFAIGDGVTTTFQLTRSVGGHTEPVYWVEPDSFTTTPLMWDDNSNSLMWSEPGSPMWDAHYAGAYTLLPNGRIQYAVAPPAGVPLTWSGKFYFRCRFKSDSCDFTNFLRGYWTPSAIGFRGSLNDKI